MKKCHYCGQEISPEKEAYYVHIKNGFWSHTNCVDTRAKKKDAWKLTFLEEKPQTTCHDDMLIEKIHTALKSEMGDLYSRRKVQKDIDRMLSDGKKIEDILNAIVYWCNVKNQTFKAYNGSLAILDYIFADSKKYYERLETYSTLNKDACIQSSLGETREVTIKTKPMRLPLGTKMFDLN